MPVHPAVENVGPRGTELGPDVATFPGTGQHASLARLQVEAVHPGRLDLLAGCGIDVGTVDQPAAIGVQITAADKIVGLRLGQRAHLQRTVQVDPE